MRRSFLITLTLVLAPAASVAAEVPRTVALEYERQDGAGHCPDAAAVRTGVAARLGYDPFRANADDHLRATIRQAGRVLEARIELGDAQGNVRARRRLVSRGHDCAELASSVELAVAIAIDPMVSARALGGQGPSREAADRRQPDAVPAAEVATVASAGPADAAIRFRDGFAGRSPNTPRTAQGDNHADLASSFVHPHPRAGGPRRL